MVRRRRSPKLIPALDGVGQRPSDKNTERLKSRKTKKTLIYNPRRRAQEFLGRFQKRPTREGASPSSWSETTNSDYLSRDEIGSVALSFPHLRALRRCS